MSQFSNLSLPHFMNGTDVSYWLSSPFDPQKATFVLINSFGTNAKLFSAQFEDSKLRSVANLLAIEPLGHGKTKSRQKNWTYWDSAYMNIEVLTALKIPEAFALGTSQGGFIAARMVLTAPEKIKGIILLGTSLDAESHRLVSQGSWDGRAIGDSMLNRWATHANDGDSFKPPDEWCAKIAASGFGDKVAGDLVDFWTKELQQTYVGETGRQKLIMMAINLKERDGLGARLSLIEAPVLYMQGSLDPVFSVKTAEQELALFTKSKQSRLVVVPGGHHFLSASNPQEVNAELIEFVKQHYIASSANI